MKILLLPQEGIDMSIAKTSKLLPILVIVILATVAAIVFMVSQSNSSEEPSYGELEKDRFKAVTVDADLPSDTLSTIAINSVDIKDEFKSVNETMGAQQKLMKEMAIELKKADEKSQILAAKVALQEKVIAEASEKTPDVRKIKQELMDSLKSSFSSLLPEISS